MCYIRRPFVPFQTWTRTDLTRPKQVSVVRGFSSKSFSCAFEYRYTRNVGTDSRHMFWIESGHILFCNADPKILAFKVFRGRYLLIAALLFAISINEGEPISYSAFFLLTKPLGRSHFKVYFVFLYWINYCIWTKLTVAVKVLWLDCRFFLWRQTPTKW